MSVLAAIWSVISKMPLWVYIIFGLAVFCIWQHFDVMTLRTEIVKAQASAQLAIAANSTDKATIKELQESNTSWQQKCSVDAKMAQEDKQQLQDTNTKIGQENLTLKQALAKAYEANSAWSNGKIDPSVEAQLRHSLGMPQGAR